MRTNWESMFTCKWMLNQAAFKAYVLADCVCTGWLTYWLTDWLTPWSSVFPEKLRDHHRVKKFPTFYGAKKVYHRIHNSPPPVPILSQIDPVHVHLSHFSKIHFNIIPHLSQGLASELLHSPFRTKTLYAPLLDPVRAVCPAHIVFLIWSP
jgi:hypothetical protein